VGAISGSSRKRGTRERSEWGSSAREWPQRPTRNAAIDERQRKEIADASPQRGASASVARSPALSCRPAASGPGRLHSLSLAEPRCASPSAPRSGDRARRVGAAADTQDVVTRHLFKEAAGASGAATSSRRVSRRLAALTAAAMALPGMHARAGDLPGSNPLTLYGSHLDYFESGGRMHVRVNEGTATVPIGDSVLLVADGLQDVISGASPIFNAPGPNGQPQQVLTGASVNDRRNAGDVGASLFWGENQVTLRQGWSHENDYKSTWTSIEARSFLNQKDTTLAAGFAFNDDGVSTHDAPDDFKKRIKRDFFVGATQVIDERSLIELSLAYSYSNGYLSDPYKLVFVQSTGLLPDVRPGQRRQTALTGKYLLYVPKIESALQVLGSLSNDNWGIDAGALEVQLKKELPGQWLINGGGRYYTQSSADFYQPLFQAPPADGLHTSDYRMAGFGSVSWLAGVTKQLTPNFSLQFSAERTYRRYALRWGGSGFAGDNYIWSFYLVTLQAQF
jgi:hypothetical protein